MDIFIDGFGFYFVADKVGILYSEMIFGGSSKSYRLGMRWELDALFDLNLTGERRESNSNVTDYAIMLKGDIRF